MQEMMDLQLAKQHREEMVREVELNRQSKALRAAGKGRAGRRSALVWDVIHMAGLNQHTETEALAWKDTER